MKAQRFLIILFFVAAHCATIFAQLSANTHYPARKGGFWTLGINGGSAFQKSDVDRLNQGWGAGLTLGKNLFYRPQSRFSFDARGRFLYDESYGLDSKRSYGIQYNNAANGIYDSGVNYLKPKGNGYIFANHHTLMGEIALEGVLTFNRLREKTGIVASVFGGIGINAYNVYSNLSNSNSNYDTYVKDFAAIDTTAGRRTTQQRLNSFLDKDYETSSESYRIGFMPALGFELGYQFAPRFHASIGHRVTYSLRDDLDGQEWNNANLATGNNDRSKYTYLKLEWELNRIAKCLAPVIELVSPDRQPYVTDQASIRVSAKIQNIRSSLDVAYKVNGETSEFNFYNPRVNQEVNLKPGRNEVEITATNECGKDVETVIIIYNPPATKEETRMIEETGPGPNITYTNPSGASYTVDNQDFTVRATINYVNTDKATSFRHNGQTRSFSFDPSSGAFSSRLRLEEGKNTFVLTARNGVGVAESEAVIYYENNEKSPSITITNPSSEYTETYEEYRNVTAFTTNITKKEQITFLVNNRNVNDFGFNPNTGEISKNLNLQEGANLIRIEVKNTRSSVSDESNIVRKRDVVVMPPPSSRVPTPPRVSFTSPSQQRTTTTENSITIRATIQNVDYQEDITFKINGRRNTNFTYHRGVFSANINLEDGNNNVSIRATNIDGNDEDNVTIEKQRYVDPTPIAKRPEVTISSPRNSATLSVTTCELEAYAKNVASKNELAVTLNGSRIDFIYNSMNKKISANLNLSEGANQVRVVAKNEGGSDEANTTVTYRRPIAPPSVNITTPTNNTTVSSAQSFLQATTQNIDSQSDISVLFNGKRIVFDYNRETINAETTLIEGNNTFSVSVKNSGGTDTKSVTVIYKKPVIRTPRTPKIEAPTTTNTTEEEVKEVGSVSGREIALKPKVTIISLAQKGSLKRATEPTETAFLKATVTGVTEKSQIIVTLNGETVDFVYDAATQTVDANLTLIKGENTAVVKATNRRGTDEDSRKVTY
jgi:large repetitive protein